MYIIERLSFIFYGTNAQAGERRLRLISAQVSVIRKYVRKSEEEVLTSPSGIANPHNHPLQTKKTNESYPTIGIHGGQGYQGRDGMLDTRPLTVSKDMGDPLIF